MDTSTEGMYIDMDLDLGPLPEPEAIETDQQQPFLPPTTASDGTILDPQTAETQSEKVHIRGVDELTTENIKQFAITHYPHEQPARIEWIDDTSANIVYSTPEIGLQALAALTHANEAENDDGGIDIAVAGGGLDAIPALRLRSAKGLASHPDSVLQVRSAVKADRKKPRAHEASRFYLMHPEHDPRERLRRELEADRRRGGGGGGAGDAGDGDYRRRRFDGRELRRRRDRDNEESITASMYDDAPRATADDDRRPDGGRGRRRRDDRDGMDLFAADEGARSSGRLLRNRSASPGRDTLMMEGGYADDRQESARRRFRERTPPPTRRNEGRELFPSSSADEGGANARELFPNKTADSYLKKELFPNKQSNHRRSDAIDAADETADLFARRISIPLVDGAQESSKRHNRGVELFPGSKGTGGATTGVNIRGAAGQDQGFAIRGAAENGISIKGRGGASVRELFPSKYGSNAGKELFSDKIEGRGGPRRRAEDMFS